MEKWREQLIKDNIRLVGYTIKHYGHYKDEAERGIATEELVRSALKFNPDLGIKFNTYAVNNMRLSIKRYNAGKRWLIANRVNGKWQHKDVYSLDKPVAYNKNTNDETMTIGDLIEDTESMTEERIIASVDLSLFLSKLSKREQRILLMKADGASQQEIASVVGVSQCQISRILRKLKVKYKEDN